jgi:LysR family transcriptional regulator, low CO2-responsive transcriptional regulator
VTFTQLRAFAMVAELGSLKAAAAALGVSEPAVSTAVSALRADLGDPLFRRTGTGIALTAGGRALALRAKELVRLAERTRREVATATSAGRLRALATTACAEHVAATVVAAFTRRVPRAPVDLAVGTADCSASALADDDTDIVLGLRPVATAGRPVEAVPFLRYRRIVVAAPQHPLAGRRSLRLDELGTVLAGPDGLEAGSEAERWAADGLPGVERCESEAAALARVRHGDGVLLALEHAVRDAVAGGALLRLPVAGTPVTGMWWATVPGEGRAVTAARALQRFLTTPDATSALLARPERRQRPRPTVRVELWS